jgi:DNA adenine methylase
MPVATASGAGSPVRPFLKWAGGKRQLLDELRRFVPPEFGVYHEPFLGSGAMFFDLSRRGVLDRRRCRLTDINPDLVGCYQAVARDPDGVVSELRALAAQHGQSGETTYYRVRDEIFNPRRRERAVRPGRDAAYPTDLAAMLIYLNRTGYNGLFRLNARGDFNVPAGRYASPKICDEETLRAAARVLGSAQVELRHAPYWTIADAAGPGDFVYLDPPYVPLSATARFTSYTPESFSDADHRRLHALVLELSARGCSVVLSNSSAPLVSELYESRASRQAGLRTCRVAARRAINSNSGRRGHVDEFIVANVTPRPPRPRGRALASSST